jgi:hypothetical protein
VRPTLGRTTISGAKLVTAGIRAQGRLSFRRSLAILGSPRSSRWAGNISLIQRGNAAKAKLSGKGYFLLAISRRNSLCLAATANASLSGGRITGRLAAAGGTGRGARLRGTGTFSKKIQSSGRVLNGRLKLRRVHKVRRLPKACRSLARTLRR